MTTDASAPVPPAEPRRLGPYVLEKELGRGAQGVVYLAEHAELHRKVALKVLTGAGAQSQLVRDRFRREAQLTSKFEHPGICGVHDVGEVDGLPYIAMQYVRGMTLSTLVERSRDTAKVDDTSRAGESITLVQGGKGGLEDVLRLVESAARALHVAHEAGLVHRDVKPANIMVTPEGQPVLLDFGLARDLGSEGEGLTQSGQILGTPAYLAPEQIVASRGTVDRRTDVYALGVTLFECLTLQRPFEGSSWDQLFHEILNGASRNPRSLNRRIPVDLATVIEVAMDRDPARRYPTAEALAEDLRRVRSFEPIQAKSAGPLSRFAKWARRRPGRAAGLAAGILVLSLAAGAVVVRVIQRGRDLDASLTQARERLLAADYVAAAVAVAKAQELDPESAEVLDLAVQVDRARAEAEREATRRRALAESASARDEESALRERYVDARRRIDTLRADLLKDESGVKGKFASDADRGAFARRQRELEQLEIEAERTLLSRTEALERAARLEDPWGGASPATQSALASFYMERWREALEARDTVRAAAMRTAVEQHDVRREHVEELLGRGTLRVVAGLPAAQVHLFRYEPYESLRSDDVIPRLVPVPTGGVGRLHEGTWPGGFVPGDPCLVVLAVEPGSPAERAGWVAGDLVLRLSDASAATSVFVDSVEPASDLDRAGVARLTRILDVNGQPVTSPFDWISALPNAQDGSARVRFAGQAEPIECRARALTVVSGLDLLHEGAAERLHLAGLHGGEPIALELAAGERSGLRCEATAYPLVRAEGNRLTSDESRIVDPGSYLVLAAARGHGEQRVHVVVPRGGAADVRIDVLLDADVPPGFVHVPPGPFVEGGDPAAFRPREGRSVDLPGFFIAKHELTNREWYEFVNDPENLARIAAAKPGGHLYLPQDDRVMAKKDERGERYTWDVYTATTADTPVLGLAWTDVRDFLVWRNARAAERGESWRYDLPSESEWEKAARGVDARAFPWGDRFDPSLTVCLVRKPGYLLDAPGGFEPRDESPYGVRDMAGSREEWLRDANAETDPPRYRKRGGHWGSSVESLFRTASRGEASQDRFASSQGVRLVARRP